ncbi:MAG: 4-hydroxy-3-methylbut-2-enyl diphosphate reductase, partial [Dehalococcoidia bacterium]|nr:4-hydroxy-3-methylbut-2-enyl diphosphate reductase [Dehalococcoidia bacterium]
MIPLKIKKAKELGFCFGVRRAIHTMEDAAQRLGSLDTLGPVVHNQRVVKRLETLGVKAVEGVEAASGVVALPSHGAPPEFITTLQHRGVEIVDATCPMVRRAQKAAQRLTQAGFLVILLGDAEHPEVKGVLGWASNRGIAVQNEGELPDLKGLPRRLGVISQSTQSPERFAEFARKIVDLGLGRSIELRIV